MTISRRAKTRPARKPPRPTKPTPDVARRILDRLEEAHPDARCALDHRNPFALFPDASALAAAPPAEVEEIIRSTGFFRAKTKSIVGFARGLLERHGGLVPRDFAAMVKLPGIGRKTANVVLGHAYGMNEGIAVDTHVLRVTNRLGLAKGDDPVEVEAQLMKLVPRERWTRTTDLLIFHGRRVCDARRPACGRCTLFDLCRWESRQSWANGARKPARIGR